MEEALYCI